MAQTLSILAPTHDRPHVLSLVWPSWIVQEGVKEIIVVDDGSNEDYSSVFAEIATACEARGISFKPVRLPTRTGAPAAKNAGLALCTCTEVLTTDDDIVLPPDMVALCRNGRPDNNTPTIIGPRVIYLKDGESEASALHRSSSDKRPYLNKRDLTLNPWVNPERVQRLPFITAVALWPRELFERGLRYYEGYGGNGYREETDPQLMAQSHFGAAVYLNPRSICFHLAPSIAYAKKSGQRRGGIFWFEYWVAHNNAIFLARNRRLLSEEFQIQTINAWINLCLSRFNPKRFIKHLNTKYRK